MDRTRRKLRDPLAKTPIAEITHTNLPLLNRFVSDNGSILPRKLTGVQMKKQKRIARAIKRAQNLALMPKIWKLPQYRRARPSPPGPRPSIPPPARTARRTTHLNQTVELLSRCQASQLPPNSLQRPALVSGLS